MKNLTKIFFFFSFLFVYSCSQTIPNLSYVKKEVVSYYESGGYNKEVEEVVNNAIGQFKSVETSDSSAVIFDVDDTALSYYELGKSISFGYVPELWDKWVDEETVPAIPQVKKLYDFLTQRGFKIIFLSGRKEYNYNGTIRNLNSAGYTQFDTLIVRSRDEYEITAVDYKSSKRVELTARSYIIVGTIGDQWSDLEGSYHGIQVKIPNYIYCIE